MKNTDIIKDKLNILDVVGSYVTLEKAGKTYKGKSPFTNEKTPSFFVSPEKGFFYCFSSQKGGDMFSFIQEVERVDFKEALKILAEKAGVELDEIHLEKNDKKSLWYKILDDAAKWYEVQLRKDTEVVKYLLARGLTKETIVKFRIGYVPDGWHNLYRYLLSKKYSDEDIMECGLITRKNQGNYYDRFRARIMFPIMDGQGRVVGFSGRIFPVDTDIKGAKYVNSPEGPLFNKSEILFGYHLAKHEIHTKDECLMVEGQFDVILCQQSGYVNTVALSGTGLSDYQLKMLKRFSDTLILALDSDAAGIKATRKTVLAAYRHGMNVRVVSLPTGMDPADTILKSKEKFDVLVHDAQDYFDYRLKQHMVGDDIPFKAKKVLVENDLFTFVYLTQSAMVQDRMLQKLSLFLGVSIEAVRKDFTLYVPETDSVTKLETESPNESSNLPSLVVDSRLDILYLAHFIYERGHTYSQEIEKEMNTLYQDIYNSDFHYDLKNLDEMQKNIQFFKLQQEYENISEPSLKNKLLDTLKLQRGRQLNEMSADLLKRIRQAEINNDEVLKNQLTKENSNIRILSEKLKQ